MQFPETGHIDVPCLRGCRCDRSNSVYESSNPFHALDPEDSPLPLTDSEKEDEESTKSHLVGCLRPSGCGGQVDGEEEKNCGSDDSDDEEDLQRLGAELLAMRRNLLEEVKDWEVKTFIEALGV